MSEEANCSFIYGSYVAMGWGCCQCRRYNGLQREQCKFCEHEPCVPLTIPSDLKQAVYREEGGETKVEIITCWFEDHEKWKVFNLRLRSIETLVPGNFGEIKLGTEFSVSVNVEYVNSAMRGWELEELKEVTTK